MLKRHSEPPLDCFALMFRRFPHMHVYLQEVTSLPEKSTYIVAGKNSWKRDYTSKINTWRSKMKRTNDNVTHWLKLTNSDVWLLSHVMHFAWLFNTELPIKFFLKSHDWNGCQNLIHLIPGNKNSIKHLYLIQCVLKVKWLVLQPLAIMQYLRMHRLAVRHESFSKASLKSQHRVNTSVIHCAPTRSCKSLNCVVNVYCLWLPWVQS